MVVPARTALTPGVKVRCGSSTTAAAGPQNGTVRPATVPPDKTGPEPARLWAFHLFGAAGPTAELADGSFESPSFAPLGGGWYAWTASW